MSSSTCPNCGFDLAEPPRPTVRPLKGRRVVVVDDDPDTLDSLAWVFRAAGAEVIACATATDAQEAIAKRRPDVLVSDIAMPDRDGLWLIRWVRSGVDGYLPSIALSAHALKTDADRALAAGYDLHVAKPVDFKILTAAVAGLAGAHGN